MKLCQRLLRLWLFTHVCEHVSLGSRRSESDGCQALTQCKASSTYVHYLESCQQVNRVQSETTCMLYLASTVITSPDADGHPDKSLSTAHAVFSNIQHMQSSVTYSTCSLQ